MKRRQLVVVFLLMAAFVLSFCACSVNTDYNTAKKNMNDVMKEYAFTMDGLTVDSSAVKPAQGLISADDYLWVIIEVEGKSAADMYLKSEKASLAEYVNSAEGQAHIASLNATQGNVKAALDREGLVSEYKYFYTTLNTGIAAYVKYGDIAKISAIENVENVVISQTYAAPTSTEGVSALFNAETGILTTESGYNGEGMTIAVVDSAFDYKHPAFATLPARPAFDVADIAKVVEHLYGFKSVGFKAEDLYRSAKVPFAFDYAHMDIDTMPTSFANSMYGGYHGTHVAGIIAADNEEVQGVVPKAQIFAMKVGRDNSGSIYDTDIIAALSDVALLGVDAVNMSLGSPCGFVTAQVDYVDNTYELLRQLGIAVICSAGNTYNSATANQNGMVSINNPESGTVGAPSSYDAALSVASSEGYIGAALNINGTDIAFENAIRSNNSVIDFKGMLLAGKDSATFEVVDLFGYGTAEDYVGRDVKGKIVLACRGSNDFTAKARLAQQNGAVGIIIYNYYNQAMVAAVADDIDFPVCSILKTESLVIRNLAIAGKKIEMTIDNVAPTYPVSDYSSWGPISDLTLKPDITAPGGNIYSTLPTNYSSQYGYMSGTSMAAPNLAGAFLAVNQYVKENFHNLTTLEMRTLAYQLMMSTATQLVDGNGQLVSPRRQGAGIVDIDSAVTTGAYLSVTGSDRTKLSLGDDKNRAGIYTLSFNLVNISDEALSYFVNVATIADALTEDGQWLNGASIELENAIEVFVKNGSYEDGFVTVEAGQTAKLRVVVRIDDEAKKYLNQFPNGTYLEGYCVLEAEDGADLSIPFLSFYGDWTEAPIFDTTLYENADEGKDYYTSTMGIWGYYEGAIDCFDEDYYDDVMLYQMGNYIWALPNDDYTTPATSGDKVAVSINGISNKISYIDASLLRDIYELRYEVIDKNSGQVLWGGYANYVSKNFVLNGAFYMMSNSFQLMIDMKDLGVYNNQQLEIKVIGTLNYEGSNATQSVSMPLFVDDEKPVLERSAIRYEDGRVYLDLEVYDNHHLQTVVLNTLDDRGNLKKVGFGVTLPVEKWVKGEVNKLSYDITSWVPHLNKGQIVVGLNDYAFNSVAYSTESVKMEGDVEANAINSLESKKLEAGMHYDSVKTTSGIVATPIESISKEELALCSVIETEEGHRFTVNTAGKLIGYDGPGGEVVIPADRGIKSIGGSLSEGIIFTDRKDITKIVVPEGVTRLEGYAFRFCTHLKEVVLPSTLTYIGGSAFDCCFRLEKVNLEDTKVTQIGDTNFSQCFALKELTIPAVEGVTINTSIYFLDKCTSLEKVTFLGDVGNLTNSVMRGCYELREVVFKGNVGNIGGESFLGCGKLEKLEFHGNVGKIGSSINDATFTRMAIRKLEFFGDVQAIYGGVFSGCANLEEVIFHGNVNSIVGAFGNCKKLTHFTVAEGNDNLYLDPETKVMYNKDRSVMMMPSCWDYDGVFTIPETVTELQPYQFGSAAYYNYNFDMAITIAPDETWTFSAVGWSSIECQDNKTLLQGVIFHDGITNLPDGTFNRCVNIKSIEVLGEADWMGFSCFSNCWALEEVILPETLTGMDGEVFLKCRSLKEITIPEDNYSIGYGAFYGCESLEVVNMNEWTEEVYMFAFAHCYNLKEFIAPSVCYIEDIAFFECHNLETVEVYEEIYDVYPYTFYNCKKLTSVNFDAYLETIWYDAFSGCESLEEFTISDNLYSIEAEAFVNVGIRKLTLENSLYFPINRVFVDCNNLEEIIVPEDSVCYTVVDGIVYNKAMTAVEICPAGLEVKEVVLPETVTTIGYAAFKNAKVEKVVGKNVVEIGAYAFYGSALKEFDTPNCYLIGTKAFAYSALNEVVIHGGILYLDPMAFAGLTLNKVTIKADATEFNYTETFRDAVVLELVIEEGYKYMGYEGDFLMNEDGTILYLYTGEASEVIIPEGVEHIMANAFIDNDNVENVTFPSTLKTIGHKAFFGCENLSTLVFKSQKAPALLGLEGENGAYANFVDYINVLETELTIYTPDDASYRTYIWVKYFANRQIAA